MIPTEYDLRCLAHISDLLASESSRPAAVTDPQRAIDRHLPHEVRTKGGIHGSVYIPLPPLAERPAELPRGSRPVVVHRATGVRSAVAASLLQRDGVTEAAGLVGGIAAWNTSLPQIA